MKKPFTVYDRYIFTQVLITTIVAIMLFTIVWIAPEMLLNTIKKVLEGVYSAKAAKALAEKYDVEMPIIMEVNKLLFENKPASEAVKDLMQREKQEEISWE